MMPGSRGTVNSCNAWIMAGYCLNRCQKRLAILFLAAPIALAGCDQAPTRAPRTGDDGVRVAAAQNARVAGHRPGNADGEVADWDYDTPDFTYENELHRGEDADAPTLIVTLPFQRQSRPGNVAPTDWSRVPPGTNYYADFYAASQRAAVSPFYKGGALADVEDDIGDHLSLQPYRIRLPNGCRLTFDLFVDMVVVSSDDASCPKGGVGGPETLAGAFGPLPPYTDVRGGDPARTWPLLHADADRRLNIVWKALQDRMAPAQKPALLAQQRRWIARRDQACLTYKGTVFHPKCLANITEHRLTWLNAQARPE